jgi:hypothetical protein
MCYNVLDTLLEIVRNPNSKIIYEKSLDTIRRYEWLAGYLSTEVTTRSSTAPSDFIIPKIRYTRNNGLAESFV